MVYRKGVTIGTRIRTKRTNTIKFANNTMKVDTEVVVVGSTPGGLAAAIRTAREGHETMLVSYGKHVGGMMTGGLSYTDTMTKKNRAPILEEFVDRVRERYRTTYGETSRQYERCEDGYVFEPHVAESIFEELIESEEQLNVYRGFRPVSVERADETIRSVKFESFDGNESMQIVGSVFIEATYEGDLLSLAGAPYRVGRETRSEYDEQFAGRLFTQNRGDRYYPIAAVGNDDNSAPSSRLGPLDVPADKNRGSLDLIPHPSGLTEIYPNSTGEADETIQAFNYRLCLSCDPENRRLPERPKGYDRDEYIDELSEVEERGLRSYLLLRYLPNDKADMNSADLPGENHDYPDADWNRRDEIAQQHRDHALGLLYFLQNDSAVSDDLRANAREWGLAKDEFTDNENFPWRLYVREARRLKGRYTFSESDARHAPKLERAPVHEDSIAITEYPLDSHACSPETVAGSRPEGFFFASQVTRPGQVPYRCLLPPHLENLLVPVPLSATHVGYGTIRLEPTWMHIGESAGCAASLALESNISPSTINTDKLQKRLLDTGIMVSFFNGRDMSDLSTESKATQFLGSKGFFDSYDVHPEKLLTTKLARQWAAITETLVTNESMDVFVDFSHSENNPDEHIRKNEFLELFSRIDDMGRDESMLSEDNYISRIDACTYIFENLY